MAVVDRPVIQMWVTRCGAASTTAFPNASDPSSTEAIGSIVGHRWVSIRRRAPRRARVLAGLAGREVDRRADVVVLVRRLRQHEVGAASERLAAPLRGRCRRCRRAACRRARSRPRPSAAGDRCARTAACRRSPTVDRRVAVADEAPVERVAPLADEPLELLLDTFGRVHGQAPPLEAVLVQHVQAVEVDAVVGMAVRDDDRGEVGRIRRAAAGS